MSLLCKKKSLLIKLINLVKFQIFFTLDINSYVKKLLHFLLFNEIYDNMYYYIHYYCYLKNKCHAYFRIRLLYLIPQNFLQKNNHKNILLCLESLLTSRKTDIFLTLFVE